MKIGQIDAAMISLAMCSKYSLFGGTLVSFWFLLPCFDTPHYRLQKNAGENLALLFHSAKDRFRLMVSIESNVFVTFNHRFFCICSHYAWLNNLAYSTFFQAKHNLFCAKFASLNNLLLTELTGQSGDWFVVFDDSIGNIDDLQTEAESSKNVRLIYDIQCHKCFMAFWREDYVSAGKHWRNAVMMIPVSKMPTILLIYQTFFGGLISFQLCRQAKDGDDEHLSKGKEMMDRLGNWAQNSMDVFENKWMLLQAEFFSSVHQNNAAEQLYKASAKVAHDHGDIHELALAHELLGKHYSQRGCNQDSIESFRKAYVYYNQVSPLFELCNTHLFHGI